MSISERMDKENVELRLSETLPSQKRKRKKRNKTRHVSVGKTVSPMAVLANLESCAKRSRLGTERRNMVRCTCGI